MHLIIADPPRAVTDPADPVALGRALRDQYERGFFTEAEYLAAHQALSRASEPPPAPQQCEYTRWGRRCKLPALAWHEGHLYCAHHHGALRGRA